MLFYRGRQNIVDENGDPVPGALATFYLSGSNTLAPIYTTVAQDIQHPNPVPATATGFLPPIYLDPSITYRYIITDASGDAVPDGVVDPIVQLALTQSAFNTLQAASDPYKRTAAEIAAGVTPVNYAYPEGWIDRYGNNTTPGTSNMTAAVQAAVNVANQNSPGGFVYGLKSAYLVTAPIVFPDTSREIKFHCAKGAVLQCNHNGHGIDWIALNENFGAHIIEGWTINGPNTFLPTIPGYVPPSTGAGINMSRNGTVNQITAYNNVIRDCVVQGFNYGLAMQCVIQLNVFGSFIEYNQYGIYIDGGATNANHFFGTHVRYNRKAGIYSTGRTGGTLTNATANSFVGCLIESNIAYVEGAFPSGGSPPTNNTGIYLSNSYEFHFDHCYSENHSASVYLTGASKSNRFVLHLGAGTGRLDQVILDGDGIYYNEFDLTNYPGSASEVTVVSNHAGQLYNKFRGQGINFISGSILANLDYHDIYPALAGFGGVGVVRMPSQGYISNVGEGTTPGLIDGIGTSSATLNATGYGEIVIGNGITGATTIDAITGTLPHQFLLLRSAQSTYPVTIKSGGLGGDISALNGKDAILTASGQVILFWKDGLGSLMEVGRNFATTLQLIDGFGAPATISGIAQLYVDNGDGDLKVKFGDGTVKTIVTDT